MHDYLRTFDCILSRAAVATFLIMSSDEREPADDVTLSSAQFGQLMSAITDSRIQFEEQLKQVCQSQDEAADKIARKVRHDRSGAYAFKKKGNERQHEFNAEVGDKIGDALVKLDTISPTASATATTSALEAANEALKEGESLLQRQQKVIKIADRSELGWSVDSEYEADKLANDSDDEKRLEKAEKAAERKLVRRRKARTDAKKHDSRSFGRRNLPVPPPAVQQPGRQQPLTIGRLPTPAHRVGPCFQCGEFGHLRSGCPKGRSSRGRRRRRRRRKRSRCSKAGGGGRGAGAQRQNETAKDTLHTRRIGRHGSILSRRH